MNCRIAPDSRTGLARRVAAVSGTGNPAVIDIRMLSLLHIPGSNMPLRDEALISLGLLTCVGRASGGSLPIKGVR